jgi:hypothetical protein
MVFQKGHIMSPEIRKKISLKLKGKVFTDETKKKISLAKTGKPRKGIVWNKGKIGVQKGVRGEKSNLWRGGITPINLKLRYSIEYKLWRKSVFERDNYTCIWCGDNQGNNLNADHIKSFAHYPELRFAIDNGRTLCESCYLTTDTYGGKSRHNKINI